MISSCVVNQFIRRGTACIMNQAAEGHPSVSNLQNHAPSNQGEFPVLMPLTNKPSPFSYCNNLFGLVIN